MLDQQHVDAIVEAMVRAGVPAAAELAGVAIEETGFGVFEDTVVKNTWPRDQPDLDGAVQGNRGRQDPLRGTLLQRAEPDLLIAVGGGSVLDAGAAVLRTPGEKPGQADDALPRLP